MVSTSTPLTRTLESLVGIPATEGNQIDVLRNGDEIFGSMLAAIEASRRSIDLVTYSYWSGEIAQRFADALAERARAGVRVRLLLDAVGSLRLDTKVSDEMTNAGVDVRLFRPMRRGELGRANNRTHRKVMICDERIGFTGGVGIADPWKGDTRNEHEWRDTHFGVIGPAVAGLRGAFIDNWAETGQPILDHAVDSFPVLERPGRSAVQIVQGDASTGWTNVASLLRSLVLLAQQRLRLTTAYFNPDDQFLNLLIGAAERGVAVEILLPGLRMDKRFVQVASEDTYESLMEAGITIWNYQKSMLHAKILTVDGVVANVGSANINHRSALLDDEVCMVIHDPDVVGILDDHFDDDLVSSTQIDPEIWKGRPAVQRRLERAMRSVKDVM